MDKDENIVEILNSDECFGSAPDTFWVFGYGSLCWNPGFKYMQSVTGYVKGFSRRFWQGNTTHRGTESKPGRVATLIEDTNGITWGKAFLVSSEDTAALPYLSNRECHLGGYRECRVDFHPRPTCIYAPGNSRFAEGKTQAVLYIATPDNCHWLGTAPLAEMAKQILDSHGPSGSNVEYLLRLADFMRQEVPEALDEHLFSLERLVRMFAVEMSVCLRSLMGEQPQDSAKPEAKTNGYEHASRVAMKKLRCVNM